MNAGRLIVFAKAPEPGRVKTRLCPPLTPEQAAEFYACLLADVLDVSARAASALGLEPVLAVHPPERVPDLAHRCPPGFRVVAQRGVDLGERMAHAAAEAFAAGARRVLLRGSDSPAVDEATLAAALAALNRSDLSICPDRDGGYSLVGLRAPSPGLFDHPMSTGSALAETLRNAERLGLRTHLLPAGFDIDRSEDLRWLATERARGAPMPCRRTLEYLDVRGLWPPAIRLPPT